MSELQRMGNGRPRNTHGFDGFPQRLRTAIGDTSIRAFARACGLSDAAVRQYLAGQSEPTRPVLLAMARETGVSLEWLLTGRGEAQPGLLTGRAVHMLSPHETDREVAVSPAAEGGGNADSVGVRVVLAAGDAAYALPQLPLETGRLLLRFIRGDAMAPLLSDGDVVLLDPEQTDVPVEGVYGLQTDGGPGLLYRRLQRLPGGAVQAASANPAYPPFTFDLQGSEAHVLGRVVWVSHLL